MFVGTIVILNLIQNLTADTPTDFASATTSSEHCHPEFISGSFYRLQRRLQISQILGVIGAFARL
jgi:ABC-type phosphate/phosphonate transport system permease subunit